MFAFALAMQTTPQISLQVDSQKAIKTSKNFAGSNETKHIDIEFLLDRDLVEKKNLKLEYCPTSEKTADMFKKQSQIKTFPSVCTNTLSNKFLPQTEK